MPIRIEAHVIGTELSSSVRNKLSRTLRRSASELLPGQMIIVVVKRGATAKVSPLHAMIQKQAEEKVATKQKVAKWTTLDKLGLAKSTVARLAAEHITTIRDLERCTEVGLLKIAGIGRKQLNEIIRVLTAHGRKLAG
jgi:DNA-directed RNA polymerase alpha subunit